jgi:Flp pilus assembly protein TadG
MISLSKFWKRGGAKGVRLWTSRRGNVALITAFMMIPLTVALGTAYDFTMAESRQDQIDGMADIATLAGVTPTQMALIYGTQSLPYSENLFQSQIATVSGVVNVTPTWDTCSGHGDVVSGATVTRTMCVTYTAASVNVFANLLGMPTFPLKGSSTATSSNAPNIDFYLLLDTSPSMEIAATQGDINTMVNNTPGQGGCAFGCHETDPTQTDTSSNPGGIDNYQLGRNHNVTFRIDLVKNAAYNLMGTAQTTSQNNNAHYRAAILTTNYPGDPSGSGAPANADAVYQLQSITSDLDADGNSAQAATNNVQAMSVWNNGCLTKTNCNNDEDTALDTDLGCLYSNSAFASCPGIALPTPGNGSNNVGDPPQEILFIVSDGVNDYQVGNGGNCGSGQRLCIPVNSAIDPATHVSYCQDIKNRNIRIAFLYTTYYPLPTNSFYNSYIGPYQPPSGPDQMAVNAQACASPGLFYEVSTGGDISAALAHLFAQAVATARLLH